MNQAASQDLVEKWLVVLICVQPIRWVVFHFEHVSHSLQNAFLQPRGPFEKPMKAKCLMRREALRKVRFHGAYRKSIWDIQYI